MTIAELIKLIRQGFKHRTLYHFTDSSNIGLIRHCNGLYSKQEQDRTGISATRPGGDSASRMSDKLRGHYDFISLSLTDNHPMAYRCRNDGRHPKQVYIPIDPNVLAIPGVCVALGLANAHNTVVLPLDQAIPDMDLDILYKRWVWSAEVQKRLQAAEKMEVLVPTFVPIDLLKKPLIAK